MTWRELMDRNVEELPNIDEVKATHENMKRHGPPPGDADIAVIYNFLEGLFYGEFGEPVTLIEREEENDEQE